MSSLNTRSKGERPPIIPSVGHLEHKRQAPAAVRCFVLTVSDTRTPDTDTSGPAICELLTRAGHQVAGQAIVRDDPAQVSSILRGQFLAEDVDVILTSGGTGISSRDGTFEAVVGLLEKRLDGFGELFRLLSFQEIGASAMMSRAMAGTAHGKAIFVLPGSEHAVRLALNRLILPELGHVVQQLRK